MRRLGVLFLLPFAACACARDRVADLDEFVDFLAGFTTLDISGDDGPPRVVPVQPPDGTTTEPSKDSPGGIESGTQPAPERSS